jgi:hypothetical protein|tara:strand:+ start:1604 stop:2203 length:600 start_codon:yes stop_codon:yes gene_type:complete
MTENLYVLTDFSPIGTSDKKTRIILTETKRDYRNYIRSLKYRYNKKNPYLPNYVITKEGGIYNIMPPDNYSNYMDDEEINKTSIIISLENLGWLKKNALSDTYVNWIGDIYKGKVFEKKWRDYFFWEPYNEEQIIALSKLIIELCDKFNIPKKTLGNNVKYDGVENFKGVVTKSNFDFIYKDTNPSFDFKLLNELIEND